MFQKATGSAVDYETFPGKITKLSSPADLLVEIVSKDSGQRIKMLLLKNVRAFYYSIDKTDKMTPHRGDLKDITIGIVYDDDSSNVVKRQNRSFCFTIRSMYGN